MVHTVFSISSVEFNGSLSSIFKAFFVNLKVQVWLILKWTYLPKMWSLVLFDYNVPFLISVSLYKYVEKL